MSNLNKKIDAKVEAWQNPRIESEHPYPYLDGIVMIHLDHVSLHVETKRWTVERTIACSIAAEEWWPRIGKISITRRSLSCVMRNVAVLPALWVFVDDGSTDDTPAILVHFSDCLKNSASNIGGHRRNSSVRRRYWASSRQGEIRR